MADFHRRTTSSVLPSDPSSATYTRRGTVVCRWIDDNMFSKPDGSLKVATMRAIENGWSDSIIMWLYSMSL
jgi:hypothetical protein